MIKTKDEILNAIREFVGENTDDATLQLLEDVDDTFADFANKTENSEDWKAKYEANDEEWRKKYRDRFFGNDEEVSETEPTEEVVEEVEEPTHFEDLFEEEKEGE